MALARGTGTSPRFARALWWLLAGDVVFIVVHLVHLYSTALRGDQFSIETEAGYAECYQYIKEFLIVVVLGMLWRRTRQSFYSGWMILYTYVLLDDSLQIHETGGEILARHLKIPSAFGLRSQDFGELAVWAGFGTATAALIVPAYFRSTASEKRISLSLAVLFAMLVFCGMGLDLVHSFVQSETMHVMLGLVEDGGEMVVMSMICAFVLNLAQRSRVD